MDSSANFREIVRKSGEGTLPHEIYDKLQEVFQTESRLLKYYELDAVSSDSIAASLQSMLGWHCKIDTKILANAIASTLRSNDSLGLSSKSAAISAVNIAVGGSHGSKKYRNIYDDSAQRYNSGKSNSRMPMNLSAVSAGALFLLPHGVIRMHIIPYLSVRSCGRLDTALCSRTYRPDLKMVFSGSTIYTKMIKVNPPLMDWFSNRGIYITSVSLSREMVLKDTLHCAQQLNANYFHSLTELRLKNTDDAVVELMLPVARQLKSCYFHSAHMSTNSMNSDIETEFVKRCVNLTAFEYFGPCASVVLPVIIKSSPNLTTLSLSGVYMFTNSEIQALSRGVPGVTNLVVAPTDGVTIETLTVMADICPSLRQLALPQCLGASPAFGGSIFPVLRRLNLEGEYSMSVATLLGVAQSCPALGSINLTSNKGLGTAVVLGLCHSTSVIHNLRELFLNHSSITDSGVESVVNRYPGIHTIFLLHCEKLTDRATLSLSRCHKLAVIGLPGRAVTLESLKTLSRGCPRIHTLHLSSCPAHVIPALDMFRKLESLKISGSHVQDNEIALLAHVCPMLRRLDISCAIRITDRCLPVLSHSFPKLKKLKWKTGFNINAESTRILSSMRPQLRIIG